MLIATPLGVALALGLTRWRGPAPAAANLLMLLPLATPEIVMGTMLFLVFTTSTRRSRWAGRRSCSGTSRSRCPTWW